MRRANTPAFLPVFKQALLRRGQPSRLFVDNGAAYRSRQLALVCAKAGIALIHARPFRPAGKGKIERYFRTLRAAWLAHLDLDAIADLDALNRSLWAWVEGEYHQAPHRGLDGDTPLDRWAAVKPPGREIRHASQIERIIGHAWSQSLEPCATSRRQRFVSTEAQFARERSLRFSKLPKR